ncbi:GGDEF domain-containing protein [Halioglobus maricola]|uniref:diguanylate cyclase n=1 Tax=Halioglobus maricola TaxID=2601894 RepID=A0A5P9NJ84_9GAMM|nr:GGDEF domain-containing protein [Halioglobus maricola]QFU75284.1 GGDEF domain-containing protein [Halioglobus maricola]
MEQIFTENWATMHLGLIFSLTLAQMLVVYVLSDSYSPPAGLGLYTVYFMTALIGWITVTLQQSTSAPIGANLPSVTAMINSYILFAAAGQRAGIHQGRIILGVICLLATLSMFFLPSEHMVYAHCAAVTLFVGAAGALCAIRSIRTRNVGDAIIAYAALLTVVGLPVALYYLAVENNPSMSQTVIFGIYSWSFALITIGFLASVLIEYQQHLSHLATEDPLTRLLNRRGLEDALQVSFAHATRHGHPTAAIVADIDHFKKVNDNFGHDTGDQVIRFVANSIQHLCRGSDVVARTGGEEFLLVLPETDLDAARILAERIRAMIGEQPLHLDGQRIAITISLGVACIEGDIDLDHLIQEADQAMYLAKQGGRNRVASVENKPVRIRSTVIKEQA